MPTYRTAGAWGPGIGVNLTPAQVDENFFELRTDLDDVIANPPTADSIVSISQSGFYLTFHTTLGNEIGPIAVPVVYTVWRGEWQPFTLYSAADLFKVDGVGIFAVLQDHTSAATFDPDAAEGSPLAPLYLLIIAVESLPADTSIGDLNDVTITSVADDDLLAWDSGTSQWTNRTAAVTAELLAPFIELDDLSDVLAPSPTLGQVLTWTGSPASWQPATPTSSLDSLSDVSVPAPDDGDVLTYQAGSPTGWVAAPPASVPSNLDDLLDVTAPTPADGDLLQFDGADWVNAAGEAVSDLDDATLPLVGTAYMEVSEPSGSPVIYASKKIEVDDLFTDRTLAGTWTLPDSGQITSAGELSLGTSASGRLRLAGTYTSAGATFATFGGTFSSSSTGALSTFLVSQTINPTGASVAQVRGIAATLTVDNSALTVPILLGNSASLVLGASYSGTVTIARGYSVSNPSIDGSGIIENLEQYRASLINLNNGFSSGTRTIRQFYALGVSGSVIVAGGTLESRAIDVTVPAAGAASGTANNRGIYITGNGGTASGSPPGTVNNFAMLSDSTAYSRVEGGLGVGVVTRNATTAVSPYFYIPTCAGTPTGVPRNAAVGASAMVFDDTAHKLWIYEQSTATWKGVVVA